MSNQELKYSTFFDQLLAEIPEFSSMYKEHMEDNDDELLPHLLMGAFTRFVFDAYRQSASGAEDAEHGKQLLIRSLDLMERAISSSDPMLCELIAASFVENLTPSYREDVEVYYAIRSLLGPKLRAQQALDDPTEDWYILHPPKAERRRH
jgi:hypothetical protein